MPRGIPHQLLRRWHVEEVDDADGRHEERAKDYSSSAASDVYKRQDDVDGVGRGRVDDVIDGVDDGVNGVDDDVLSSNAASLSYIAAILLST